MSQELQTTVVFDVQNGITITETTLKLIQFWAVYRVIQTMGEPTAAHVTTAVLLSLTSDPPLEVDYIFDWLQAIHDEGTRLLDEDKDYVVHLTYDWLRSRQINPMTAAEIGSALMGKEFSSDAWRMRVKRWAKENGRPPVEQRKRRVGKANE